MTNESKLLITTAIDKAGYSWQVQENMKPPLVSGETIVIEETITFTATKRTEIQKP